METAFDDLIAQDNWVEHKANFRTVSFWNSLLTCKVENGMLNFGMINPIDNHLTCLVARDCYFKLWNLINRPEATKNIVITGTPGVGRTVFLIFVLWKCRQEGISCVYFDNHDISLWHRDKVYSMSKNPSSCGVLSCFNLLVLADSTEPILCNARCLMVTPPNMKRLVKFEKRKPITKYYMPPWTLNEWLLLYESCYKEEFSKEDFMNSFKVWGGVPRYIYNSNAYSSKDYFLSNYYFTFESIIFDTAILEKRSEAPYDRFYLINVNSEDIVVDHDGRKTCFEDPGFEFDSSSMKTVKAFQHASVSFCNEKFSEEAFESIKTKNYFLEKVFLFESYAYIATPLGSIFEKAALVTLAKGGSFPYRRNGCDSIKEWNFSMQEVKPFVNVEDITSDGLYIAKEKNLPFDAILASFGVTMGINVKIDVNHSSVLLATEKYKRIFGKFCIVFVLPENLFLKPLPFKNLAKHEYYSLCLSKYSSK